MSALTGQKSLLTRQINELKRERKAANMRFGKQQACAKERIAAGDLVGASPFLTESFNLGQLVQAIDVKIVSLQQQRAALDNH